MTERLMTRFEGQVPLTTVGQAMRRVLREHDGPAPSMTAVEEQAAGRLERLAARLGTRPTP